MNDIVSLPASEWHNCYDDGWQGEIVPEAFAHPAKVSRALIRRIYQHAFVEGWLVPGDIVVDPFGGIGGTALDAMWSGLAWVGCELEPKFVGLAGENIEQWQRKYGGKAGFGSARIVQGDSRKLSEVIARAGCVVLSPPYADALTHGGQAHKQGFTQGQTRGRDAFAEGYGFTPGQLEKLPEGTPPALICSSPPYAAIATGAGGLNTKPGADGQQSGRSASSASQNTDQRYGETAGQLATMREGEALACIVSSPPFSHPNEQPVASQSRLLKQGYETFKSPAKMARGSEAGNLEAMPEGRFDAVVSSPPYECARVDGEFQRKAADPSVSLNMPESAKGYGGSETGRDRSVDAQETFWSAAREIVAQCHSILRPGGHAIWITKDFVRKGKRVPFSDQWQALCEAQGFTLVCRHRAMLVKHHGSQDTIFGGVETVTTSRKSFFRRLCEAKGAPPIDWEDVVCMVKP